MMRMTRSMPPLPWSSRAEVDLPIPQAIFPRDVLLCIPPAASKKALLIDAMKHELGFLILEGQGIQPSYLLCLLQPPESFSSSGT